MKTLELGRHGLIGGTAGALFVAACSAGSGDDNTGDMLQNGMSGSAGLPAGTAGGTGTGGIQAPAGTGGAGNVVQTGMGGSNVVTPGAGGSFVTPGAGGGFVGAGGSEVSPGAGGADVGAGGTDVGTAGAAGDMGSAGAPNTGPTPKCITNGSQGAILGDSYVTGALTPALQPELDKALAADGAVTGYRNYAVAGTAMGSGGLLGLIPDQWPAAQAGSSDLRLIIMDGGGNDILIPALGSPDCKNMQGSSMDPGCQAIVAKALDASKALMMKMADAGIRDVVFFFYPDIPAMPGGLGGSNPKEMLDYSYPLAQEACDTALQRTTGRLRCHFVDLREPFAQGGSSTIAADGVHPSASGQQIMAREIYAIMKENCLGQPASAGCCEP